MNGRDMQTMNDQELVNALREHAEWARAAGAEWNRRNGIKLKGRECDG